MSGSLAASLVDSLPWLNARLRASHGTVQQRVGNKVKSCWPRDTPQHAVRFHELLFSKKSYLDKDSDETTLPEKYTNKRLRTKRVQKVPTTRSLTPDKHSPYPGTVEIHFL